MRFLLLANIVKIIISFVLVFSGLFLLEIYLWSKDSNDFGCEHCRLDSRLGWAPIPNRSLSEGHKKYTINSLGFRSKEPDPSKEHILILGDSVAFGLGVNDNETVSHYIQKKVSKYQVLNLSVPGYSIDQYYLHLKNNLVKTNPKFIVSIISSVDDWTYTIQNNFHGINKPYYFIRNGALARDNNEISMLSCGNYFNMSLLFKRLGEYSLPSIFCDQKKHNKYEGKKVIGMLLDKILKLGQSAGAKVIFVLSPTMNDFFVTTCGPGTNFSFCESNHKNHPEFFFKNLKLFQKYLLDQQNKGAYKSLDSIRKNSSKHSSWAWYLRFKNLFSDYNLKYLDIHGKIMEQNANIFDMYLEDDNYHYSDEGNKFLAEVVFKQLQIGNDTNISEYKPFR
tara:strand:+ start:6362 stop:7540 length:1179 start_codon:yes stop_codon:yes gene_type:complete